MEATVSNQIIEVLDALCEKFGFAIDWTGQNVLPYMQELMSKAVNYELGTSVMWIVIIVLPTIIACKMLIWSKNQFFHEDEEVGMFFWAFSFVGLLVCAIVFVCQVLDIITCLTFPEKIIFSIIQDMM